MLKELQETMFKELKESMTTISHQISQWRDRNHMKETIEILELESPMATVKSMRGVHQHIWTDR